VKTILITGGAGFIGSNFVRYLYQKYPAYRLIVLDALTYAGNIQNLPVNINEGPNDRLIFWYGNVVNGELVDTLVSQSNVVIHFAAESHVTRSIYDNYLFFEVVPQTNYRKENGFYPEHTIMFRLEIIFDG